MKLVVREAGSELVARAAADAEVALTSSLTYVEARAALARMRKLGRDASPEHDGRLKALDHIWERTGVIRPSDELIKHAGDLCDVHLLRAFDAVQLASCRAPARKSMTVFACWDNRLRKAAAAEGLPLLPA